MISRIVGMILVRACVSHNVKNDIQFFFLNFAPVKTKMPDKMWGTHGVFNFNSKNILKFCKSFTRECWE